jgi:hypothetical protein
MSASLSATRLDRSLRASASSQATRTASVNVRLRIRREASVADLSLNESGFPRGEALALFVGRRSGSRIPFRSGFVALRIGDAHPLRYLSNMQERDV